MSRSRSAALAVVGAALIAGLSACSSVPASPDNGDVLPNITVSASPSPSSDASSQATPSASPRPTVALEEQPPKPLDSYDLKYAVTVPAGGQVFIPFPQGVTLDNADEWLLTMDPGAGIRPKDASSDGAVAVPAGVEDVTNGVVWTAGQRTGTTYMTWVVTNPDTKERTTAVEVITIQ